MEALAQGPIDIKSQLTLQCRGHEQGAHKPIVIVRQDESIGNAPAAIQLPNTLVAEKRERNLQTSSSTAIKVYDSDLDLDFAQS